LARPQLGYWAEFDPEGLAQAVACPRDLCLESGEYATGRKPAVENPLCGQCLPGLYQWGSECVPCERTQYGVIVLLVLFIVALVLVFHRASQSSAADVKIFMFFLQTGLLLTENDSLFVLEFFKL
jgi:hypothetical protein